MTAHHAEGGRGRAGRSRLPNLVTATRFALLPVLWVLALLGLSRALGWVLLAAWLTDVLDGALARRLNTVSATGSRLDTVGDHLLLGSMLVWVVMLEPEFVRAEAGVLGGVLLLWLISLVITWLRFRRFADLHLYSSKAGVLLVVVFTVHLFLVPGYSSALLYVAAAVCALAAVEALAVVVTRSEVDEHVGSIFLAGRR